MAVKISNIYYMLAYAFQGLTAGNETQLGGEEFENLHSLFAEIILRGMTQQIKRGIHRDYSSCSETLSSMRGKINIAESINGMTHLTRQLVCEYDEFTEDTLPNRTIKAAITILLRHGELAAQYKYGLRRLLAYLVAVSDVRPPEIRFDLLKTQRMNAEYKMLLSLCRMLFDSLLMTEGNGEQKMKSFLPDEKMHQLYERFAREYYRYHYPELNVSASQISWDIEGDDAYLPAMRSDIALTCGDKTLIIDTKYYSRTMSQYFGKKTYHSHNLYQIYTYVKNADTERSGKVSGALLYAKTDETITPDSDVTIGGNHFSIKTLDLSQDFRKIREQLDNLVAGLRVQSI